jgi:hypothetical protein
MLDFFVYNNKDVVLSFFFFKYKRSLHKNTSQVMRSVRPGLSMYISIYIKRLIQNLQQNSYQYIVKVTVSFY